MKSIKSLRGIVAALFVSLLAMFALPAAATQQSMTSTTVIAVYPIASGDFLISLSNSSTHGSCSGVQTFYVVVGANSMTSAGSSKIYAGALAAYAQGTLVDVAYDDGTAYCYVNGLNLHN